MDAVLVARPLPQQLSSQDIWKHLSPAKDIDGITAENMDILTAAGLTPLIIDVDAFTLETVYEHLPSFSPADTHGVLILNIGHRVTNLTILEKGVTRVARDIFIAGNAFNRALIKNMAKHLRSLMSEL